MSFTKNKSVTIVIVDDDKDDHFFLGNALREVLPNVSIQSFYNGCEFIEHLKADKTPKPNLIFLDLNMPKMDGRETTNCLKQNDVFSTIPLIIFTTSISLVDRLELTDLGADDFYSKPVCSGELIKIVEKVSRRWL